ncbi:chemotaxis protein CheB [Nostoc sp. NMS8]|uniref:chemotaxis protein CheB n=1 Tax=Nostoc sp. NMS8 TaxID=2815392 RepID=UPI0025DEEB49|nr:chemotaxis protein CheB [Nostoc sp. NMS8]MBN3958098.1 chemotaxis protein CheB [Nostoc sp. NMS8]
MALQKSHRILSHFPNIAYNIVAIGASVGGQKPIIEILSALPVDFLGAIIVVQHMNPLYPSRLAHILRGYTALPVEQAKLGQIIRPGTIYTYVEDRHLVVEANGTLCLLESPKINFVRPSVDKLFMSVGLNYGIRGIAIVLSGCGRDGALGVIAIKNYGGTTIAQDQTTSEYFDMPSAAIDTGKVDFVLSPEMIAKKLSSLAMKELVA